MPWIYTKTTKNKHCSLFLHIVIGEKRPQEFALKTTNKKPSSLFCGIVNDEKRKLYNFDTASLP